MTIDATTPLELWDNEVKAMDKPATAWLWDGYLAPGNFTLLSGLWKGGKTTLLSLLLNLRKQGGTLAGKVVKPGKTVVVTEERWQMWAQRLQAYDFGVQVLLISRPFRGLPTPERWQRLIDRVAELQVQHNIDLMVLDPLAPLLRNENNPQCILESLLPLNALTDRDMAVLAMHHPPKGSPAIGQGSRGTGALPGHVDISLELRHPGGDPFTRRRRLLALSRHSETPCKLLMELNAAGTEYTCVTEDDGFDNNWEVLCMVFEDAPQKLTRADVLEEWPADYHKPAPSNLWKWLDRAVRHGRLCCEGSGRKADPFRYWFATTEARWKQDPCYDLFEELRIKNKLPFQSLTERNRLSADDERVSRGGDDGDF